ncbi:Phospholipase A1-II 5 [Glycine max]|nr:Phospholipase A1-II 5 [Glycine max]
MVIKMHVKKKVGTQNVPLRHHKDVCLQGLPPPLALVRGLGPRVQLNQLRDHRVELVIPGTLGREIYVVWRGTSQDMEWINVFGVVQANDSKLIIAKSLKELKGGNKDNKGMTHETRNLSKVRSPKVGNKAFNERFNKFQNLKVLHVKNMIDLIPHYPGKLLG